MPLTSIDRSQTSTQKGPGCTNFAQNQPKKLTASLNVWDNHVPSTKAWRSPTLCPHHNQGTRRRKDMGKQLSSQASHHGFPPVPFRPSPASSVPKDAPAWLRRVSIPILGWLGTSRAQAPPCPAS